MVINHSLHHQHAPNVRTIFSRSVPCLERMSRSSAPEAIKISPNSNSISLRLVDCALQAKAINQSLTLKSLWGPSVVLQFLSAGYFWSSWNWFLLHCFVSSSELYNSIVAAKNRFFHCNCQVSDFPFSLVFLQVLWCNAKARGIELRTQPLITGGNSHARVHSTLALAPRRHSEREGSSDHQTETRRHCVD